MRRVVVTLTMASLVLACGADTPQPLANTSPNKDGGSGGETGSDATASDARDAGKGDGGPSVPDGTAPVDTGGTGTHDPGPDVPPPPPCIANLPCDDGNPCTFGDTCGKEEPVCTGTPYECHDGRPCTDDTCLGNGDCAFPVKASECLIANVCYAAGATHPENDCVVCDPTFAKTEWALAGNGAACGTGDVCLGEGTCSKGACLGATIDCEDGNACTDDRCKSGIGCQHLLNVEACDDADPCTVGDHCQDGACAPGFMVLACDDGSPCTLDLCGGIECIHVPTTLPCDDGTACTLGDVCYDGKCHPGIFPKLCDDGNTCTQDVCHVALGCIYAPVDSSCCFGGVSICDDQNPCTTDVCDEATTSCKHEANTAQCDDGQVCTGPDTCKNLVCVGPGLLCEDGNPCTVDTCKNAEGGCAHEPGAELPCDDQNPCTQGDKCKGGACLGAGVGCDDKNVCTADACDPTKGGCTHVVKVGPCEDGDACTLETVCTATGCQGKAVSCDDKNACTNDVCHSGFGCQHQPIGGPCDDGLQCSTGDACTGGKCKADTSQCGCIPTFSTVVTKVTKLNLGIGGLVGQGLDVDKNAATCAPADNCNTGIDNQLAVFSGLANDALDKTVSKGDTIALFEHQGFKSNGATYTLAFLPAKRLNENDGCDHMTQTCDYLVQGSAMNSQTCLAVVRFDNARIQNGTTLKAGGKGYTFPLDLPVQGAVLKIVVSNAEIQGTVTLSPAGDAVTSFDGVLAGAIPKDTFLTAIDALKDKDLPPPLTKEQVKQLIDALIQNDIDINGDKKPDAASIGLTIKGISGKIVGLD